MQDSPLWPLQKLELLQSCILPTIGSSLSLQKVSKGYLIRFDAEVQKVVRKILHLPHYTPLGFCYAKCREGGLGLGNMQTFVPCLAISQIDHVFRDGCDAIASLVNEEYLQWIQRWYLDMMHPLLANKKLIADYWRQNWLNSMASKGLDYLRKEKISTLWISYPICKSCEYIDLIKLLSQTLPCHGQ